MRYRAGTCLLKLARVKAFDKALSEHFETVASLVMDACETVRHKFLLKLGEVLPAQRLLPRWNLLPALAAIDPELENQSLVSCPTTIVLDDADTVRRSRLCTPTSELADT